METIFLLMFILINSVLINFCSLCLKKYANTHCNEDNEEDIKHTEKILYYCGISCCAILSFILLFFGNVIFKCVPIFITGISLICRLNKKQKLANVFCGIIIIPTIVCIILVGVIGFFQAFKPCEYKLDDSQMTEIEIQQFNSRFTQYEGENATGTQVKSLLQQVISSNANEEDKEANRIVTLNLNGEQENDTTKVSSKIVNSHRYKIYYEYNNDGCVNKVIIEEKIENNSINTTK